MKNIRHNVFETNSSSSHSISISTDTTGVLDTIECDDDGVITIRASYFGREWEAYNDPMTKASYCLSDCKYDMSSQDMLRVVIKEHTGASEVRFEIDDDSYIDHESTGNSDEGFTDLETLRSLIFNPESYIFTGSDETSPPPNFYDVGKDIVFTHQLEIEGTDLVYKFKKVPDLVILKEAIESIMDRYPLNRYSILFSDYCNCSKDRGSWEIIYYPRTDINGNNFSSLTMLDQGIIILYKVETRYTNNGKYLGEKILASKELFFKIVEI